MLMAMLINLPFFLCIYRLWAAVKNLQDRLAGIRELTVARSRMKKVALVIFIT